MFSFPLPLTFWVLIGHRFYLSLSLQGTAHPIAVPFVDKKGESLGNADRAQVMQDSCPQQGTLAKACAGERVETHGRER